VEFAISWRSQWHPSAWCATIRSLPCCVTCKLTLTSGPVPQDELFDDLDAQGEQLLNSLHLGPAEEEPVRRGAASRANSVRFDESALHGSSWGGHNSRHSGDFGPARPGSGLMMERSLSHKSDGRHSSTGHSVHSHVSVASGRASSLGLDTNFAVEDDDDDASLGIPEPPASFFVLGSVPSIVRCWLTTNYAHATLLYADVCTGSQKSTVDFSLLRELDLLDEIQRDVDGTYRARLSVYFAEATVTQHNSRSHSPERNVPSMTVSFEVTGVEGAAIKQPTIRIYIGSDALRAHSADILFSRNTMVLYGDDRSRLRVPFIRPEDENVFRHICTTNVIPDKPKLNANAAPFILGDATTNNPDDSLTGPSTTDQHEVESQPASPVSPIAPQSDSQKTPVTTSGAESGAESEKSSRSRNDGDASIQDESNASDISRRESSGGIWGSWRNGGSNGVDGAGREGGLLSGYQPAVRGGRNMKVLKSHKSTSASARTRASYEPPAPSSKSTEARRKGQVTTAGDGEAHGSNRWDTKRAVSSGAEAKSASQSTSRETRNSQTLPRTTNPVGGASAFSWMTPPAKSKAPTTAE
jgi:hypothetical protein